LTLESFESPGELYLARGVEVNPLRPLLTGDIFAEVVLPGVQEAGMAIIVAHPCSMRGKVGTLKDRLLAAAVRPREHVGQEAWRDGYFGEMPLPDLRGDGTFYSGFFGDIGQAPTEGLSDCERLACLSHFGINLLQQRLVWHLTRFAVPTSDLHDACAHTLEEADLLEEWNDILRNGGVGEREATSRFEAWLRAARAGGRSYQSDLRDPQRRASVRAACRAKAREIAEETTV
jgi:hypothetical protein